MSTPPPDDDTIDARHDRRVRRLIDRIVAGARLDPEADPEDDPFAEQRQRVDAPVRRLFTTFGPRYRGSLLVGLVAGFLARFADLLPPLVLGVAIDAVFLDRGSFALPGLPAGLVPGTRAGQFWLSAGLISGVPPGVGVELALAPLAGPGRAPHRRP